MTGKLRAAYPDMERARRAIDSLERAGVDGESIHLAGRPSAEAATDRDTRAPDARVTRLVSGGVGGVIGGVSSVDMSRAWELTQHRVEGGLVYVTVHSTDPEELQRAEEALKVEEPIRLHRKA